MERIHRTHEEMRILSCMWRILIHNTARKKRVARHRYTGEDNIKIYHNKKNLRELIEDSGNTWW
jgi:hypothetical protein